jgi:hypothetical protein
MTTPSYPSPSPSYSSSSSSSTSTSSSSSSEQQQQEQYQEQKQQQEPKQQEQQQERQQKPQQEQHPEQKHPQTHQLQEQQHELEDINTDDVDRDDRNDITIASSAGVFSLRPAGTVGDSSIVPIDRLRYTSTARKIEVLTGVTAIKLDGKNSLVACINLRGKEILTGLFQAHGHSHITEIIVTGETVHQLKDDPAIVKGSRDRLFSSRFFEVSLTTYLKSLSMVETEKVPEEAEVEHGHDVHPSCRQCALLNKKLTSLSSKCQAREVAAKEHAKTLRKVDELRTTNKALKAENKTLSRAQTQLKTLQATNTMLESTVAELEAAVLDLKGKIAESVINGTAECGGCRRLSEQISHSKSLIATLMEASATKEKAVYDCVLNNML